MSHGYWISFFQGTTLSDARKQGSPMSQARVSPPTLDGIKGRHWQKRIETIRKSVRSDGGEVWKQNSILKDL